MGGSVKVVVRKENGEILAMRRWTNSLSSLLKVTECYKSTDSDEFKEYMQAYNDMKADYEKNRNSGDYELNMTSLYFNGDDYDKVIPEDYGIVVVDHVTKNVISSQGYTGRYETLFFRYKYKEIDDLEISIFDHITAFDKDHLLNMIKNQNFVSVNFPKGYLDYLSVKIDPVSLKGVFTLKEFGEKLTELAKNAARKNKEILDVGYFELEVDINGFNYLHDENIQNAQNKLAEIGFPLTEEELAGWEKFKKRYDDDE